jgi:hypothetical protein
MNNATKPTIEFTSVHASLPMKRAHAAIELASQHKDEGRMHLSAKVCLEDARYCYRMGLYNSALFKALSSLEYSVGVFHPDYAKAKANGTISSFPAAP